MDITIILSMAAMLISLVGLLLNSRKDTRTDAAASARMEATLGSISNGVEDIRVEMRTMRSKLDDHGERLARVEARAASNTHRLDALDKTHKHPPDCEN